MTLESPGESWLTSRRFWTDTLERVLRTTAQAAVAVFATPVAVAGAGGNVDLPWQAGLIAVAGTAVLTFLTCLAGKGVGDSSTASLTTGTEGPSLQGVAGMEQLDYGTGKHRAE